MVAETGNVDRAEVDRLIGYHGPFSSTCQVMLSKNRLIHNSNVAFNDADCGAQIKSGDPATAEQMGTQIQYGGHHTDSGSSKEEESKAVDTDAISETCKLFEQHTDTPVAPIACEYFEWTPGGSADKWLTHADTPQPRPRPRYEFLCSIEDLVEDGPNSNSAEVANLVLSFVQSVPSNSVDHEAVNLACLRLAMVAHKDMSWEKVLNSSDRESAVKALKAERDSLMSTILTPVDADHPERNVAVKEAISGRFLLDLKRVGVWKARGVKQGFKENKETADGPGFVYYAYVAMLASVRMLLSRPNRGS